MTKQDDTGIRITLLTLRTRNKERNKDRNKSKNEFGIRMTHSHKNRDET